MSMPGGQYGANHGFVVPPMPSAPPPAPADGWRAAGVAVLNLSGLGIGYALLRRPLLTLMSWVATGLFLFAALPADPDGIPGGVLTGYGLFVVLAAAHGAYLGLRHRLVWPPRSPLAVLLGVTLLLVPVAGGLLYDSAREEATQQMLLDRLKKADRIVRTAADRPFDSAEPRYREALSLYDGLTSDHPGSRAAERVPDRLETFYSTVGAAYEEQKYCDAVAPLRYLRTVPRTLSEKDLGSLSTWPDDRLATSLYECGTDSLEQGTAGWTAHYTDLFNTFPRSEQAGMVEPAVKAAVDKAIKAVDGDEPCAAVSRLESLSSRVKSLPGAKAGVDEALAKDTGRADARASTGGYDCGVDQYRDGDFDDAETTMKEFVNAHKKHPKAARAKKIAIAAEVAQTIPAAGKKLPTTRSGGGITVTVKNDSPDDITVLYTGPVTGSFTLKGCGSCKAYSFSSTLTPGFKPCSGGKNYPQRTISLPTGTTYFVHKSKNSAFSTPASDTAKLSSGYIYTECAYTTQTLGGSGLS